MTNKENGAFVDSLFDEPPQKVKSQVPRPPPKVESKTPRPPPDYSKLANRYVAHCLDKSIRVSAASANAWLSTLDLPDFDDLEFASAVSQEIDSMARRSVTNGNASDVSGAVTLIVGLLMFPFTVVGLLLILARVWYDRLVDPEDN